MVKLSWLFPSSKFLSLVASALLWSSILQYFLFLLSSILAHTSWWSAAFLPPAVLSSSKMKLPFLQPSSSLSVLLIAFIISSFSLLSTQLLQTLLSSLLTLVRDYVRTWIWPVTLKLIWSGKWNNALSLLNEFLLRNHHRCHSVMTSWRLLHQLICFMNASMLLSFLFQLYVCNIQNHCPNQDCVHRSCQINWVPFEQNCLSHQKECGLVDHVTSGRSFVQKFCKLIKRIILSFSSLHSLITISYSSYPSLIH